MCFLVIDTFILGKKIIRVLPAGVETMNFRLLVRTSNRKVTASTPVDLLKRQFDQHNMRLDVRKNKGDLRKYSDWNILS